MAAGEQIKYIWDDIAYDETGKGYNIDQLSLFNARNGLTGKSKLLDTAMYAYDNYIGDSNKNSFDKSGGFSSLLNMYSIPKTLVDAQFGVSSSYASPQMEEELRKQIMSDIRRTGKTSGGISYGDLGFDTMYNSTGEHIDISKNPGFRHPLGMNTPQQALGLTGGKMDYSVDPTSGKVIFTGGTDYDFGAASRAFPDTEWNPDISIDPALIQKEMNAFSPQERYMQGKIELQKPKEVYPNTEEHFKQKFQEDKTPFKVVREPWNKPTQTATPKQIQQAAMMDNQLQHQTISKPVLPAPVKSTPVKTVSPGGGNSRRTYSKPAASSPAPVFKSYGPPNMQRFR